MLSPNKNNQYIKPPPLYSPKLSPKNEANNFGIAQKKSPGKSPYNKNDIKNQKAFDNSHQYNVGPSPGKQDLYKTPEFKQLI